MRTLMSLVVAVFLMGGQAVVAEAGDCDGLLGAESGLCNAYCEKMDCDGDAQASEKACDKVKEAYMNMTGQPPPCWIPEPGNCPAWTESDLTYAVACIDNLEDSYFVIEEETSHGSGDFLTYYFGRYDVNNRMSVGLRYYTDINGALVYSGFLSAYVGGQVAMTKSTTLTVEEYGICLDEFKLAIGLGN